jgi:hypothetical protein
LKQLRAKEETWKTHIAPNSTILWLLRGRFPRINLVVRLTEDDDENEDVPSPPNKKKKQKTGDDYDFVPETHVSQTEFCARAYNTRLFARCSN